MGCDNTSKSGISLPTFQRNLPPPPPFGQKMETTGPFEILIITASQAIRQWSSQAMPWDPLHSHNWKINNDYLYENYSMGCIILKSVWTCGIVEVWNIHISRLVVFLLLRQPSYSDTSTGLVDILHCLTNVKAAFCIANRKKFIPVMKGVSLIYLKKYIFKPNLRVHQLSHTMNNDKNLSPFYFRTFSIDNCDALGEKEG